MNSDGTPKLRVIDLQEQGILLVEDGNHGENRPRRDEFVSSGVAFIRAADMADGRVLFATASKINDTAQQRIRKGVGAAGDVLLSHKGTVGKVAMVPKDAPPFVCSPQTTFWRCLQEDVLDRGYLYAYLNSRDFHNQLASRKGETDMADYVSLTAQRMLTVPIPPIDAQRRIAEILGTLDDKIQLTRRMNETMEAMVRRLFRSWFVNFDPVHAKAALRRQHPKLSNAKLSRRALPSLDPKIAELFPDSFADSTLGPIPIGWKVGSILETADLLSGGTPKTSEPRYWDGDIMWASAKDVSQCREPFLIDTERRISKAGLENSSTKLIDPYSTVVVSRGATTGRLAMFGDSIAMNQTCYALRTRLDAPFHLFCHAGLVMNELVQTAHGSVFDTITTRTFAASAVLIAPQELVRSFNRIITPVFTAILGNQRDATTLQTIRDKLLPRLLSGQLPVDDSVRL